MARKMKQLLIVLASVMLAGVTFADDSGLNPQFVKWRKMKAAGFLPEQRAAARKADTISLTAGRGSMVGDDLTGQVVGLAPDVAALGYLSDMMVGSRGFDPVDGYPRKFDLRDENCLTAVRNQGKFETCWAFASFGSLESSILVQKPADQTYTAADIDFSERHLVDNHGFDGGPKDPGSMLMAMAYLLRWGGPASESSVPYPASTATAWPTEKPAGDGPRLHVQNVRWLPGKTGWRENDVIKKHVMEKGGVYATLYMNTNRYYDVEHAAYWNAAHWGLFPEYADNHGVTIVGWDDDYPGENFKHKFFNLVHPLDGAYLVKNSWGEEFGENGYFWVSYYDSNFARSPMAVFCGNETKKNYATIYQYDELGYTGKSHAGNSKKPRAWMANVFTPETDDSIAAVGFYALVPNISYSIRVYTKCGEDEKGDKKGPATGKLWRTQNGTVEYAGYVTVPLDGTIDVKAGEKFAVCVQIAFNDKTRDANGNTVNPLPYEAPVNGYSSKAVASSGQSYYSQNGEKWYDLADSVRGANFCLKAYGVKETDPDDWRKLKEMSVDGPKVVVAGQTATFTGHCIYDDDSVWDEFTAEYEIVSDENSAVDDVEVANNAIKVTAKPSLTEDSRVVLRISYTDDESGITVSLEFAITITKAVPAAPTGLRATADAEAVEAGVRLVWDAVANASAYAVYRSTGDDSRNAIFLTTVETTKFTDLTASPGTDYTYFVKAQNSSGSSAFSEGAKGWRKLAAPHDFTASDGDFDYVQLTWAAPEGACFYKVYRDTDMDIDGNPTENAVAVTDWIDKLACQDTPPLKGTNYIYWVQAALAGGQRPSAYSIFDLGSRAAPITLGSVQIQGAASVSSGSTAAYTLNATLSNGTRLENVDNVTWSCSLADGTTSGSSYTLTALVNDRLVASNTLVSVTAVWTFQNEDGSATKQDVKYVVISPIVPAKPNAPKIVSSTVAGVSVEWTEVEGASDYRLYRGDTVENAQLLLSTAGFSYTDTKVLPGATYRYWVEAVNAAGASEKSEASLPVMRQFTPPVYVTASNGTSTEDVLVSWRAVTGANRYRVSRADTADGTPHALSGWIEGRTFSDTTATPGKTYWYFVQAAFDENGGSASDYSAATIGKVSPAQTLAFVEIDGPSSIQYDSQGAYVCTATYANGVTKRVNPTWSFKSANPLVTVGADGIVTAGHVTGDDLHLELQASFTDNGVTKTDSFAVTVIAFVETTPTVFVSNVVVRARWPWNGIVDISYDLYSSPATTRAVVTISGTDHDLNRTLQAVTVSGDGADKPAAGGAPHRDCLVSWNLGADYENFHASAFSVSLAAAPFAVAAPADFRASDNTSTNGVELAWEQAFGAEYYEIFRQLSDGSDEKVRIASVTNATEFLDTTAEAGEPYKYWIRTVAGEFETDVSDEAGPVTGKRLKPTPVKPSVDLQDGLVAYYPFDDHTDDRSGNDYNLVFSQTLEGETPSYVAARGEAAAKAYRFPGNTDLRASTNGVVVLEDSFTFSAWVRPAGTDVLRPEQKVGFNTGCNFVLFPWQFFGDAMSGYGIAVSKAGVNLFEYSASQLPCTLRYAANLGDGWHHVAFTVSESAAPLLYVDGVYVKTGINSGYAKRLAVGQYVGGGEFGHYNGLLDDACYYNRALDADEISALYEAGSPLSDGKPVSVKPTVDVAYGKGLATVTISCVEKDAAVQPKVYYSIVRKDGGETVEAREYTVPFVVEGNATVIAWSMKDGYYNSPRVRVEVKAAWKDIAHDTLAPSDTDGKIDFTTFGEADWVFDPDNTSDNVEGSMRSGVIDPNGNSSMSATVTGEGQFVFDWKVSSEAEFDYLAVTVDGETAHKISGEVDWTELVLELTNDATHVITWTYAKDASVSRGSDCGWVDHVTWAPLGSAVDAPFATVTPLGEGAENGASNEVALACAKIADATIEYRVDLFGEKGEWAVYDGPFVIEGEATVFARAKKSGYVDSFTSKTEVKRPWLIRVGEALLMDPVTKASIALEADYYEYGIDEAFWWDQDRAVVSDGTCASVRSPALGDGPAGDPLGIGASIFAKVSGAGTLYFDWKVDSEAGWDVLTYYAGEELADYAYAEAISGDRDWDRIKLVFTANALHVIEWEYNKDDRGKAGRDCGWVDYLKWVPARYAPVFPDGRTGYVFNGWSKTEGGEVDYKAGEMLDAEDPNESFFAVWSPITYKLVYDAQVATDDGLKEQSFTYDAAQNLYPASQFAFKCGYTFVGWTTNAVNTVDFEDGASVMNLASVQDAVVMVRPVESPITYQVMFFEKNMQPSGDETITATYDQNFTFPTPAPRNGYRFDGWSASPTNDLVVYAAGQSAKNLGYTQDEVVCFFSIWTQLGDSVAEALDATNLVFTMSGDAPWFAQSAVVKVGETALQSGAIGDGQSSVVSTTYTTTNRLQVSFWWKVSSESGWDKLQFLVDGNVRKEISGEQDWTQETIRLAAGEHTFSWKYVKDGSASRGSDCGWLDALSIVDLEPGVTREVYVATTGNDATGDGSRSNPYATVVKGVASCGENGTVRVLPGEYAETVIVDEYPVRIVGEGSPTNTTIRGVGMNPIIRIVDDGAGTTVDGFKLTGGVGWYSSGNANYYGGAVSCHASAEIRNCIITGNNNSSITFGGGIHTTNSGTEVLVYNCLFADNYAWACGGASLTEGGSVCTFDHCTVYGNRTTSFIGTQGGIGIANTGTAIVKNCILWGNDGSQVDSYYTGDSTLNISYTFVQGGAVRGRIGNFTDGGNNSSADPKFAETTYFTLASDSPCKLAADDGTDAGFSLSRINGQAADDPLAEAIDYAGLVWTTGGRPSREGEGVTWFRDTGDSSDGNGDCATSGAGGAGDAESWMKTTIVGPCRISFDYLVQTYNGTASVTCDGNDLYRYQGVTWTGQTWKHATYDIPAGTHELKFTYHHPGMGYAYQFNGFKVDKFSVER